MKAKLVNESLNEFLYSGKGIKAKVASQESYQLAKDFVNELNSINNTDYKVGSIGEDEDYIFVGVIGVNSSGKEFKIDKNDESVIYIHDNTEENIGYIGRLEELMY